MIGQSYPDAVEYGVLGPLRVRGPHGPVELRGLREQLLLAMLLGAQGRAVPAATLRRPPSRTSCSPCRLALDVHPSWTPDGRILFLSDRTGGIGIWTMATEGSDARLVIDLGEEAAVAMPYMSANGERTTFMTTVHVVEGDRNVYTVRSDGGQLRRLVSPGDDLGPTFASGSWVSRAGRARRRGAPPHARA